MPKVVRICLDFYVPDPLVRHLEQMQSTLDVDWFYPSAGAFLRAQHDATVEAVAQSMRPNAGDGLPVAGWYELVRELEIQHALGRL